MKADKNKIIAAVMLLFIALMTGCDRDNQKNSNSVESAEKMSLTFPEVYVQDVDETLSFHASIIPPVGLQRENKEIQVTYKVMDFDMALDELFSDVGKITKKEMILQPENSLYQCAYGEQNEILSNSVGMLRMERTHWAKVQNTIELARKDLAYNAGIYTMPQKFSFGAAEECWETLLKVLQKLGVETELKPEFFYMDYETMEREDRKNSSWDVDESENKVWSEEDNGYYISAVQCFGGNTIFANTYFGSGIEGKADTANVLAYVDKTGVQMLELTRMIDQIVETDKCWQMLPFEDIVDAVKKRFGLVMTGDRVEVKEFRFSYMTEAVSDEVYRLIPVWFCNYEQAGIDGVVRMRQLIIHAATGVEVIYELY